MSTKNSKTMLSAQVVAEASAWFVAFRFDNVDERERNRFSEWLRRSPEHIQAYLEIARSWADLPQSDPAARIDVQMLISRARESDADIVPIRDRLPTAHKAGPAKRSPILLAASLAFLCVAIGVFAWSELDRHRVYATDIGEQRSIKLADGSTVDLNARSKIRVMFSDKERDVELVEGQALFEVAKNPRRPFVVQSAGTRIRAVGTQFDVNRMAASTVVTVVEGRVTVSSISDDPPVLAVSNAPDELPAHPHLVYVSAGEQVTVATHAPENATRADVNATTAWIRKKMVYDATPLAQVAEEFNRYNTRALIIDDAQLGTLGITGVYSSTDPASLLRFLRSQAGIRVIESDRDIRITRAASR